jgi:hypothetical protein
VLLAARYELHDIPDVEALCTRAARTWAMKTEARLSPDDFESLAAFLIAAVWRMSERYDRDRSSSFEAIVRNQIGNRCVDWLRTHRGRTRWQFAGHTHTREIPRAISLDVAGEDGLLGESVGRIDDDLEASHAPEAFGGLLDGREREAPWDTALVRALARRLTREHARPK